MTRQQFDSSSSSLEIVRCEMKHNIDRGDREVGRLLFLPLLFLWSFGFLSQGCRDGSSSSPPLTDSVTGEVMNGVSDPVAGATVYLIPTSAIDLSPITTSGILDGDTEPFDEPLEDLVRGGSNFPQAMTGTDGSYRIDGVTDGSYFFYVEPADSTHLPGGDICRESFDLLDIGGGRSNVIRVSGQPSPASKYVGTTACLSCHPDQATQLNTLHRLGFRVPGTDRGLQDSSRFPEFDQGLEFFFEEGRTVFYYDFDSSRGFDKYVTSLDPPPPGSDPSLSATFVKRGGNNFIRLENLFNPSDPGSGTELKVELTYGGGLFKQRYLVRVGKSLYPCVVQYQDQGRLDNDDRTRKPFRDYHADYFYDESTKSIKNPPLSKAIEVNCLSCHATNYSVEKDAMTGEWIGNAVNDRNGAFDINQDGLMDEINLGCEVCHGPGQEHVIAARAEFIVQPQNLPPGRANVLCGQCHGRPRGNGDVISDQTINAMNKMMLPGTSRDQFLTEHTSRKDATFSDLWDDEVHSKSHHQQYSDHIKGSHYRNRRQMVTCFDCHEPHGQSPHTRQLLDDPSTDNLCFRCHTTDPLPHMMLKTGSIHIGDSTRCTDCHMIQAAKTGSGVKGNILDALSNYWKNDITSHVMDVPRKTNVGVEGKAPGKAMPIPYTLRCGQACHAVDTLQD